MPSVSSRVRHPLWFASCFLLLALGAGCGKSGSATSPSTGGGGGGGGGTTGHWTITTVDSAGDPGAYAHIAVDDSGRVAISYLDRSSHFVKCAVLNGTNWDLYTLGAARTGSAGGGNNAVALGLRGRPTVVYHCADLAYKWTAFDGANWSPPATISWTENAWAFLDGSCGIGIPVGGGTALGAVSLTDSRNGNLLATWGSAGSQATQRDIQAYGHTGANVSAKMDGSGRLNVSYTYQAGVSGTPGTPYVAYGQLNAGSWTSQLVDTMASNDVGYGTSSMTSIAIDGTGHPGIAYYTPSGYKYAYWNGSAWSRSIIDRYQSSSSVDESIAFDHAGAPHVALLGNSYGSLCLKHAVLSGSTWTEEIVDATTGYSCSIAVDAAGKVYIAYHDPNTLKLRVAIRTP